MPNNKLNSDFCFANYNSTISFLNIKLVIFSNAGVRTLYVKNVKSEILLEPVISECDTIFLVDDCASTNRFSAQTFNFVSVIIIRDDILSGTRGATKYEDVTAYTYAQRLSDNIIKYYYLI